MERVTTFAALLRGINVGGRNSIPMADLRASLTSCGLEDVSTYIQSGNIVFRTAGEAASVVKLVGRRIAESFGMNITVLLRTHDELAQIVERNPFPGVERNAKALHVVFLDRAPASVETLDPDRSPPDRFGVVDREIYVHYPKGSGRSKLTLAYFERQLGVRGTGRNWNTLLELIARSAPR